MKKLFIIVGIGVALFSVWFFGNKLYFQGLNAGLILKHEGDVVHAFTGLQVLKNTPDTETYQKVLVGQLNTALFSMAFADRDVKCRPPMLKLLTKISSPQMKPFMEQVRKMRIDNGWQSADSDQEQRIQSVLDRYISTGNAFGFQ